MALGYLLSYNIWLYIKNILITILPPKKNAIGSVVEGDGFVRR